MRLFPPLLAILWLGGCASPGENLPTCDGQHRRPANPYGSVLTDPPAPTVAAAPTDPASLQPCGGAR